MNRRTDIPSAMKTKVLYTFFLLLLLPCCLTLAPPSPRPVAQVPEDPDRLLFQQAEKEFQRQSYPRALQLYTTYLERYPKGRQTLQARLRQGELLGLTGNWQESLRTYEALLVRGLDPDTTLKVRYHIGRAYFKLGHYHKAVQVLDSLTAADLPVPLRFSTNALLAEIALKQGQVDHAFTRLRLAGRDLAAGDQEWFQDLKTRLVEQATPAELSNLVNLYRDDPLSAALLLRLAQLAQEGGRGLEAQKWAATLQDRFPDSKEAAAAGRLLAGQKWLFGCLLPLSGDFGPSGRRVKQGLELAVRGAQVELLFKDCPNEPAAAAQAVRELAQDQRFLALIGPITSAGAQGAAQAAQESGLPLLALTQKADVTQAGPLIFQAFLTARAQIQALLRYTMSIRGIRNYAVLAPDSPYGRTFGKLFQEEVLAKDGAIIAQADYAPGTRDFAGAFSILTVGSSGPPPFEALLVPDDPPTVAALAQQLTDSPLKGVQLLGTNLVHPTESQKPEAQNLQGLVFVDAFYAGDPNPAVAGFVAAYLQTYGEAPDYLAAQGYAVGQVLARLLEQPGPMSRADFPQKLQALRNFPDLPWFKGLSGERQAELALYILTIRDGRVELAR
jgi:ABC-type branched-subunit amino acid transport system substrate-binding protein